MFIDSGAGLVLSIWFVLAIVLNRENKFIVVKLTVWVWCGVAIINRQIVYRGGWSRTRELIHDVHKQRFGIKFACSYDYLKVNLKFNRYASFTLFNPGIPGE